MSGGGGLPLNFREASCPPPPPETEWCFRTGGDGATAGRRMCAGGPSLSALLGLFRTFLDGATQTLFPPGAHFQGLRAACKVQSTPPVILTQTGVSSPPGLGGGSPQKWVPISGGFQQAPPGQRTSCHIVCVCGVVVVGFQEALPSRARWSSPGI